MRNLSRPSVHASPVGGFLDTQPHSSQDWMRRWEITHHQAKQPDNADDDEYRDDYVLEWLRNGNDRQQPINQARDQHYDHQIDQKEHVTLSSQG